MKNAQTQLGILREWNGGTYPARVDGGYPVLYYFGDFSPCCADCANGKNHSNACEDHWDVQWRLVGFDVFYEGATEYCAQCNAPIESAYGDPFADEVSAA